MEQRVSVLGRRLNLDQERARKLAARRDADRARLVRHYFGQDIEDPLLYDCVWNMGRVPVETLARGAVDLAEERCRLSDGILPRP